jgi:hypothetical protein
VAEGLVVGIFPNSDPKALESALAAQNVDLSKVKVVSCAVRVDEAEASQLEFVDVIEDMEDNSFADDMTKGLGVLDDASGTGVPGITSSEPNLESFTHESASRRYLAGYSIPDDEVDNFDDAVSDGRAVVLYPNAGADEQTIAAAFKAAGLRNVRAY